MNMQVDSKFQGSNVDSARHVYAAPQLSLLGFVCNLTEAGSSGSMEGGNCTDDMGSMQRIMC